MFFEDIAGWIEMYFAHVCSMAWVFNVSDCRPPLRQSLEKERPKSELLRLFYVISL